MVAFAPRFEERRQRCTVSLKLRLRAASWRDPQRLGLAPRPSIRLATPRRLVREMLETGFCHHHIQVRAPVSRWLSMRSRLAGTRASGSRTRCSTCGLAPWGSSYRAAPRFTTRERAEADGSVLVRGVVFLAQRWPIEPLTPLSIRSESAASPLEATDVPRILDRFYEGPVKVSSRPRPRAPSIEVSFLSTPDLSPTPRRWGPFGSPPASWNRAVVLPPRSRFPGSLRSRRAPRLLGGANDIDLGIRARLLRF